VSIDLDGIYSMLIKKASIDDCSRKKQVKTSFKIGALSAMLY
jgi:hypothetical protein